MFKPEVDYGTQWKKGYVEWLKNPGMSGMSIDQVALKIGFESIQTDPGFQERVFIKHAISAGFKDWFKPGFLAWIAYAVCGKMRR